MKRSIIGVFGIIISLLWSSSVFAQSLPSNLGHVQDRAAMFTKEQKAELRQAAQSGPLNFYLLTVAGLNGREPSEYATAIYQAWELNVMDVLIIIAEQERRIEMNFNHPELDKIINGLQTDYDGDGDTAETKITELVDKHFIPLARQGDFTQASLSLFEAVNELSSGLPSGTVGTVEAEVAAPVASERADSTQTNGFGSVVGMMLKWVARMLLTVLIVIAAAAVIYFLIRGQGYKRRLLAIREAFAAQMVDITRALDAVTPHADISKGRAGSMAQASQQNLTKLLIATKERVQELDKLRISILNQTSLKRVIGVYEQGLKDNTEAVLRETGQADELIEIERSIAPIVKQLQASVQEIKVKLETSCRLLQSPLDRLAKEVAAFQELTDKVADTALFDAVEASELARRAERSGQRIAADLADTMVYYEKSEQYAELVRTCIATLKSMISEHQLHAIKVDPYISVKQTEPKIEQLRASLHLGNLAAARSLWEEIEALLSSAVNQIKQQAELRMSNRAVEGELYSRADELFDMQEELKDKFRALVGLFSQTLWREHEQSFHSINQRFAEARQKLAEAKAWSSDVQQLFEQARAAFDDVIIEFGEVASAYRRSNELIDQWHQLLEETKAQFRRNVDKYEQTLAFVRAQAVLWDFRPELNEANAQIKADNISFAALLDNKPYDLTEIENRGMLSDERMNGFIADLQRLSNYKAEALQALADLDLKFHHQYRRAARHVKSRYCKKTFSELKQKTDLCIKQGYYENAHRPLQQIQQLIDEMEFAFQQGVALEQERLRFRQEQERISIQRQMNSFSGRSHTTIHHHHHHSKSRNSFFAPSRSANASSRTGSSSSGSSGAGSSSGGSSWGGSSSAGSSFGGGGGKSGNSSGGSNW